METIRKPNPVLNEMPRHVMEMIVGMGGVEEKYRLRKVCKPIRSHIDTMKIDLMELAIWIHDSEVCYDFDSPETRYMVRYRDHLDGCTVRKEEPENDYDDEEEDPGKLVVGESFWKIAAQDLSIFLKNPRLEFTTFKVTMNRSIFSDLFFEHLLADHQKSTWQCRYFVIRYDGPDGDLVPLFSHLSSAHLEGIYFEKMDPSKPITEMVKMKQWRRARWLYVDDMWMQMMELKHFKHFRCVKIGVEELTVEQFGQILEHFSTSPSNNMQRCSIEFEKLDLESLKPILETDVLKFHTTERIQFSREFENRNSKSRFSVTVCNGGVVFSQLKR